MPSYVAQVWIEYQSRRFMRPDAGRLAAGETLTALGWKNPREKKSNYRAAEPDATSEADKLKHCLAVARLRLDWELFKLSLKARKALHPSNFQPRVPAGNPEGGEWTTDGAAGGAVRLAGPPPSGINASRRDRAKGHHYVPRQLYENRALPEETRKVFEDARTGRLHDIRSNRNDRDHRIYNSAVSELFDDFLVRNGIVSETMTPNQAWEFVKEVVDSKDPQIRNFNMRIQLREIMHRVLTRTRGNE